MKKKLFLYLLVTGILLSGCSNLFQGKVPMSGDSAGSLSDMFAEERKITVLEPPAQVFVSDGYSSSSITLSWSAVTGAASYMIERAVMAPAEASDGTLSWETPGDEQFEVLEQFVYETGYTDQILTNPRLHAPEYRNKYYYRIIAENIGKKYDSSEPTAVLCGALFPPPSDVKASLGTSNTMITVQWGKVPNAASYNIYRSEYASGASPYLVGSVYGNQMWYRNTVSEAEQGKEFYYLVYAVNGAGNTSIAGNLAMGYALVNGAPDAPANVRLADGSGRGDSLNEIRIEWDPSPEGEAYYAVYRYSSNDSSLTRLTEKTTDPHYADNQVKPGLFYYYQVQTIVEDDGKVLKSPISMDTVEGYILSPPMSVSAVKNEDTSVSVIWSPAIGSETERDAYTYRVYGDNSLTGSFSSEVISVFAPAVVQSDGYIHADNLTNNYTFYKVVTVNAASVESAPSETVSPPPAAAVMQDATKAAFIAGGNANASGLYPVRVTWKKPDTETPSSYHVYRSTQPDSGFRKITNTPVAASSENTGVFTYTDMHTAKIGKLYYYRVLSLNSLGQGSYYSDIVSGYGAITHEQYMIEFNKTIKASHKKLTLMHKPNNLDKLGSESVNGGLSGTLRYDAKMQGLGARITMVYSNYTEFYIENNSALGAYFSVTGSSNTTAKMDSSGSMDGTIVCTGMYPGKIYYDKIDIKGGNAGGGTYGIQPDGFLRQEVSWELGDEE